MRRVARWWGVVVCRNMYEKSKSYLKPYGFKIDYGDWCGRTFLLHEARFLMTHPRLTKKARQIVKDILEGGPSGR
jgi:hypothetical protein